MPVLSDTDVLALWERGERLPPAERAVSLAAAGADGPSEEEVASLPLGRRDLLLLGLRRSLSGPALDAIAPCPACDEVVELSLDLDELANLAPGGTMVAAPVVADGWTVAWRPITSADVTELATAADADEAEGLLLAACTTSVVGPHGETHPAALPSSVRAALGRAMEGADPLAEVLVDLRCPSCDGSFVADIDLAGFVWRELRERARALLHEVDLLARAYGWTEADVLALSADRRAAYVRLVLDGSP